MAGARVLTPEMAAVPTINGYPLLIGIVQPSDPNEDIGIVVTVPMQTIQKILLLERAKLRLTAQLVQEQLPAELRALVLGATNPQPKGDNGNHG